VTGRVGGQYAQPGYYNAPLDTTQYLSVPANAGAGSVTYSLGSDKNYLGLYWSTIDSYNVIRLLENGTVVATIPGAAFNGSESLGSTSEYVNILVTGGNFNQVEFSSSQYAFELDNLTVSDLRDTSPVPEPASLALLGSGFLGGIGAIRRRFNC
jgi:PEP-CTERM motif